MAYTLEWALTADRASAAADDDATALVGFCHGKPPDATWANVWENADKEGIFRLASRDPAQLRVLIADLLHKKAQVAAGFAEWRLAVECDDPQAAERALECGTLAPCPALRALATAELGRHRGTAAASLQEAVEICEGEGPLLPAWLQCSAARAAERVHDYERADDEWHGAARQFRRAGLDGMAAECGWRRARACLEAGKPREGLAILDALPSVSEDLWCAVHWARAELLMALGRVREAQRASRAVRERSRRYGQAIERQAAWVLGEPAEAFDPEPDDGQPALAEAEWALRNGDRLGVEAALRQAEPHARTRRWKHAILRLRALAAAPCGESELLERLIDDSVAMGDALAEVEARLWRARTLAPDAAAQIQAAEKIALENGYSRLLTEVRVVGRALGLNLPATDGEAPDLAAIGHALAAAEAQDPRGQVDALSSMEDSIAQVPEAHQAGLRRLLEVPLARIRLRRTTGAGAPVLLLHSPTLTAWLQGDTPVQFSRSPLQFRLLCALVDGASTEREPLFVRVWDRKYLPPSSDNSLYVGINRLKASLEHSGMAVSFVGDGYRLQVGATYVVSDAAPVDAELPVAPRGPRTTTTNFVDDTNSFVGRTAELEQVQRALASGTIVSILGMSGLGKTRLARAATKAALAEPTFDEVWWCDLDSTNDSLSLAILRVLGVSPASDRVAQVGRTLARRGRVLLVVDGAERVLSEAKNAIPRWAAAAPEARLLITSRERLWIPAESVLSLGPLNAEDAAALFVERARAAGGAVDAQDPDLRRLLQCTEQIPLAIELTAARSAYTGLPNLIQKFGQRGTPMKDAIAVAWEGLSAEEKRVLKSCSVFFGGFDDEAVEAVLEVVPGVDLAKVLASLCDKSALRVVSRTPAVRYAMFQMVASHAAGQWSEAERLQLEARHAAVYAERAALWTKWFEGPRSDEGLANLRREYGNLEAAYGRALAARQPLAIVLGYALAWPSVTEATDRQLEILHALVDLGVECQSDRLGDVLASRGSSLVRAGRSTQGEADFQRILSGGFPVPTISKAACRIAELRAAQSRWAEASASRLLALKLARECGDAFLEAVAVATPAHADLHLAEWRAHHEAAVTLARNGGFHVLEASVNNNLYAVLTHLDDPGAAKAAFERGEFLSGDNAHLRMVLYLNAGLFLHWQGKSQEGVARLRAATEIAHDNGNPRHLSFAHRTLALIAIDRMRPAEAADQFRAATELQRSLTENDQALLSGWWGMLDLDQGRLAEAERKLGAVPPNVHVHGAFLRGQRGSVPHARGDRVAALAFYLDALETFHPGEVPHWRAVFHARVAAILWEDQRGEEAAAHHAQAVALAQTSTFPMAIAAVQLWGAFQDLAEGRLERIHQKTAVALAPHEGGSCAQQSMEVRFALRLLDEAMEG